MGCFVGDLVLHRQKNTKFRPAALGAYGGDKPIVFFDDLFGDSQPDPRTLEFVFRTQSFEEGEDAGKVFFVNANSIVADADETKRSVLLFRTAETTGGHSPGIDVDPRRDTLTREFEGIAE